ncbi:hypothetical protein K6168_19445 [Streptomyces sp. FB2]|uniref:hypothetical protein n=1 Tax=Streptomyces sp. FB2 TaxID=2902454 RepID=UPI001F16CE80|nr:hypothetical protein [Streptomyces sp. FB2]MCF2537815.1 hypothetical protein [Streptomyces sp. FB2]
MTTLHTRNDGAATGTGDRSRPRAVMTAGSVLGTTSLVVIAAAPNEDRQREVAAGLDDLYAPSVRNTTPTTGRTTGRNRRRTHGAVVVRRPLTGLDNKEPPGH